MCGLATKHCASACTATLPFQHGYRLGIERLSSGVDLVFALMSEYTGEHVCVCVQMTLRMDVENEHNLEYPNTAIGRTCCQPFRVKIKLSVVLIELNNRNIKYQKYSDKF